MVNTPNIVFAQQNFGIFLGNLSLTHSGPLTKPMTSSPSIVMLAKGNGEKTFLFDVASSFEVSSTRDFATNSSTDGILDAFPPQFDCIYGAVLFFIITDAKINK